MAHVAGEEVVYKKESRLGMTTLTYRSKRYTFPSVIVKGDLATDKGVCIMLDMGLFCPFCTGSFKAKFISSQSRLAVQKTGNGSHEPKELEGHLHKTAESDSGHPECHELGDICKVIEQEEAIVSISYDEADVKETQMTVDEPSDETMEAYMLFPNIPGISLAKTEVNKKATKTNTKAGQSQSTSMSVSHGTLVDGKWQMKKESSQTFQCDPQGSETHKIDVTEQRVTTDSTGPESEMYEKSTVNEASVVKVTADIPKVRETVEFRVSETDSSAREHNSSVTSIKQKRVEENAEYELLKQNSLERKVKVTKTNTGTSVVTVVSNAIMKTDKIQKTSTQSDSIKHESKEHVDTKEKDTKETEVNISKDSTKLVETGVTSSKENVDVNEIAQKEIEPQKLKAIDKTHEKKDDMTPLENDSVQNIPTTETKPGIIEKQNSQQEEEDREIMYHAFAEALCESVVLSAGETIQNIQVQSLQQQESATVTSNEALTDQAKEVKHDDNIKPNEILVEEGETHTKEMYKETKVKLSKDSPNLLETGFKSSKENVDVNEIAPKSIEVTEMKEIQMVDKTKDDMPHFDTVIEQKLPKTERKLGIVEIQKSQSQEEADKEMYSTFAEALCESIVLSAVGTIQNMPLQSSQQHESATVISTGTVNDQAKEAEIDDNIKLDEMLIEQEECYTKETYKEGVRLKEEINHDSEVSKHVEVQQAVIAVSSTDEKSYVEYSLENRIDKVIDTMEKEDSDQIQIEVKAGSLPIQSNESVHLEPAKHHVHIQTVDVMIETKSGIIEKQRSQSPEKEDNEIMYQAFAAALCESVVVSAIETIEQNHSHYTAVDAIVVDNAAAVKAKPEPSIQLQANVEASYVDRSDTEYTDSKEVLIDETKPDTNDALFPTICIDMNQPQHHSDHSTMENKIDSSESEMELHRLESEDTSSKESVIMVQHSAHVEDNVTTEHISKYPVHNEAEVLVARGSVEMLMASEDNISVENMPQQKLSSSSLDDSGYKSFIHHQDETNKANPEVEKVEIKCLTITDEIEDTHEQTEANKDEQDLYNCFANEFCHSIVSAAAEAVKVIQRKDQTDDKEDNDNNEQDANMLKIVQQLEHEIQLSKEGSVPVDSEPNDIAPEIHNNMCKYNTQMLSTEQVVSEIIVDSFAYEENEAVETGSELEYGAEHFLQESEEESSKCDSRLLSTEDLVREMSMDSSGFEYEEGETEQTGSELEYGAEHILQESEEESSKRDSRLLSTEDLVREMSMDSSGFEYEEGETEQTGSELEYGAEHILQENEEESSKHNSRLLSTADLVPEMLMDSSRFEFEEEEIEQTGSELKYGAEHVPKENEANSSKHDSKVLIPEISMESSVHKKDVTDQIGSASICDAEHALQKSDNMTNKHNSQVLSTEQLIPEMMVDATGFRYEEEEVEQSGSELEYGAEQHMEEIENGLRSWKGFILAEQIRTETELNDNQIAIEEVKFQESQKVNSGEEISLQDERIHTGDRDNQTYKGITVPETEPVSITEASTIHTVSNVERPETSKMDDECETVQTVEMIVKTTELENNVEQSVETDNITTQNIPTTNISTYTGEAANVGEIIVVARHKVSDVMSRSADAVLLKHNFRSTHADTKRSLSPGDHSNLRKRRSLSKSAESALHDVQILLNMLDTGDFSGLDSKFSSTSLESPQVRHTQHDSLKRHRGMASSDIHKRHSDYMSYTFPLHDKSTQDSQESRLLQGETDFDDDLDDEMLSDSPGTRARAMDKLVDDLSNLESRLSEIYNGNIQSTTKPSKSSQGETTNTTGETESIKQDVMSETNFSEVNQEQLIVDTNVNMTQSTELIPEKGEIISDSLNSKVIFIVGSSTEDMKSSSEDVQQTKTDHTKDISPESKLSSSVCESYAYQELTEDDMWQTNSFEENVAETRQEREKLLSSGGSSDLEENTVDDIDRLIHEAVTRALEGAEAVKESEESESSSDEDDDIEKMCDLEETVDDILENMDTTCYSPNATLARVFTQPRKARKPMEASCDITVDNIKTEVNNVEEDVFEKKDSLQVPKKDIEKERDTSPETLFEKIVEAISGGDTTEFLSEAKIEQHRKRREQVMSQLDIEFSSLQFAQSRLTQTRSSSCECLPDDNSSLDMECSLSTGENVSQTSFEDLVESESSEAITSTSNIDGSTQYAIDNIIVETSELTEKILSTYCEDEVISGQIEETDIRIPLHKKYDDESNKQIRDSLIVNTDDTDDKEIEVEHSDNCTQTDDSGSEPTTSGGEDDTIPDIMVYKAAMMELSSIPEEGCGRFTVVQEDIDHELSIDTGQDSLQETFYQSSMTSPKSPKLQAKVILSPSGQIFDSVETTTTMQEKYHEKFYKSSVSLNSIASEPVIQDQSDEQAQTDTSTEEQKTVFESRGIITKEEVLMAALELQPTSPVHSDNLSSYDLNSPLPTSPIEQSGQSTYVDTQILETTVGTTKTQEFITVPFDTTIISKDIPKQKDSTPSEKSDSKSISVDEHDKQDIPKPVVSETENSAIVVVNDTTTMLEENESSSVHYETRRSSNLLRDYKFDDSQHQPGSMVMIDIVDNRERRAISIDSQLEQIDDIVARNIIELSSGDEFEDVKDETICDISDDDKQVIKMTIPAETIAHQKESQTTIITLPEDVAYVTERNVTNDIAAKEPSHDLPVDDSSDEDIDSVPLDEPADENINDILDAIGEASDHLGNIQIQMNTHVAEHELQHDAEHTHDISLDQVTVDLLSQIRTTAQDHTLMEIKDHHLETIKTTIEKAEEYILPQHPDTIPDVDYATIQMNKHTVIHNKCQMKEHEPEDIAEEEEMLMAVATETNISEQVPEQTMELLSKEDYTKVHTSTHHSLEQLSVQIAMQTEKHVQGQLEEGEEIEQATELLSEENYIEAHTTTQNSPEQQLVQVTIQTEKHVQGQVEQNVLERGNIVSTEAIAVEANVLEEVPEKTLDFITERVDYTKAHTSEEHAPEQGEVQIAMQTEKHVDKQETVQKLEKGVSTEALAMQINVLELEQVPEHTLELLSESDYIEAHTSKEQVTEHAKVQIVVQAEKHVKDQEANQQLEHGISTEALAMETNVLEQVPEQTLCMLSESDYIEAHTSTERVSEQSLVEVTLQAQSHVSSQSPEERSESGGSTEALHNEANILEEVPEQTLDLVSNLDATKTLTHTQHVPDTLLVTVELKEPENIFGKVTEEFPRKCDEEQIRKGIETDDTDWSHMVSDASTNIAHFETDTVLSQSQAAEFLRHMLMSHQHHQHEEGDEASEHQQGMADLSACLSDVCKVTSEADGENNEVTSEEISSKEISLVFVWPKKKDQTVYQGKQPYREINVRRITRIKDFEIEVLEGPVITETKGVTPDETLVKAVEEHLRDTQFTSEAKQTDTVAGPSGEVLTKDEVEVSENGPSLDDLLDKCSNASCELYMSGEKQAASHQCFSMHNDGHVGDSMDPYSNHSLLVHISSLPQSASKELQTVSIRACNVHEFDETMRQLLGLVHVPAEREHVPYRIGYDETEMTNLPQPQEEESQNNHTREEQDLAISHIEPLILRRVLGHEVNKDSEEEDEESLEDEVFLDNDEDPTNIIQKMNVHVHDYSGEEKILMGSKAPHPSLSHEHMESNVHQLMILPESVFQKRSTFSDLLEGESKKVVANYISDISQSIMQKVFDHFETHDIKNLECHKKQCIDDVPMSGTNDEVVQLIQNTYYDTDSMMDTINQIKTDNTPNNAITTEGFISVDMESSSNITDLHSHEAIVSETITKEHISVVYPEIKQERVKEIFGLSSSEESVNNMFGDLHFVYPTQVDAPVCEPPPIVTEMAQPDTTFHITATRGSSLSFATEKNLVVHLDQQVEVSEAIYSEMQTCICLVHPSDEPIIAHILAHIICKAQMCFYDPTELMLVLEIDKLLCICSDVRGTDMVQIGRGRIVKGLPHVNKGMMFRECYSREEQHSFITEQYEKIVPVFELAPLWSKQPETQEGLLRVIIVQIYAICHIKESVSGPNLIWDPSVTQTYIEGESPDISPDRELATAKIIQPFSKVTPKKAEAKQEDSVIGKEVIHGTAYDVDNTVVCDEETEKTQTNTGPISKQEPPGGMETENNNIHFTLVTTSETQAMLSETTPYGYQISDNTDTFMSDQLKSVQYESQSTKQTTFRDHHVTVRTNKIRKNLEHKMKKAANEPGASYKQLVKSSLDIQSNEDVSVFEHQLQMGQEIYAHSKIKSERPTVLSQCGTEISTDTTEATHDRDDDYLHQLSPLERDQSVSLPVLTQGSDNESMNRRHTLTDSISMKVLPANIEKLQPEIDQMETITNESIRTCLFGAHMSVSMPTLTDKHSVSLSSQEMTQNVPQSCSVPDIRPLPDNITRIKPDDSQITSVANPTLRRCLMGDENTVSLSAVRSRSEPNGSTLFHDECDVSDTVLFGPLSQRFYDEKSMEVVDSPKGAYSSIECVPDSNREESPSSSTVEVGIIASRGQHISITSQSHAATLECTTCTDTNVLSDDVLKSLTGLSIKYPTVSDVKKESPDDNTETQPYLDNLAEEKRNDYDSTIISSLCFDDIDLEGITNVTLEKEIDVLREYSMKAMEKENDDMEFTEPEFTQDELLKLSGIGCKSGWSMKKVSECEHVRMETERKVHSEITGKDGTKDEVESQVKVVDEVMTEQLVGKDEVVLQKRTETEIKRDCKDGKEVTYKEQVRTEVITDDSDGRSKQIPEREVANHSKIRDSSTVKYRKGESHLKMLKSVLCTPACKLGAKSVSVPDVRPLPDNIELVQPRDSQTKTVTDEGLRNCLLGPDANVSMPVISNEFDDSQELDSQSRRWSIPVEITERLNKVESEIAKQTSLHDDSGKMKSLRTCTSVSMPVLSEPSQVSNLNEGADTFLSVPESTKSILSEFRETDKGEEKSNSKGDPHRQSASVPDIRPLPDNINRIKPLSSQLNSTKESIRKCSLGREASVSMPVLFNNPKGSHLFEDEIDISETVVFAPLSQLYYNDKTKAIVGTPAVVYRSKENVQENNAITTSLTDVGSIKCCDRNSITSSTSHTTTPENITYVTSEMGDDNLKYLSSPQSLELYQTSMDECDRQSSSPTYLEDSQTYVDERTSKSSSPLCDDVSKAIEGLSIKYPTHHQSAADMEQATGRFTKTNIYEQESTLEKKSIAKGKHKEHEIFNISTSPDSSDKDPILIEKTTTPPLSFENIGLNGSDPTVTLVTENDIVSQYGMTVLDEDGTHKSNHESTLSDEEPLKLCVVSGKSGWKTEDGHVKMETERIVQSNITFKDGLKHETESKVKVIDEVITEKVGEQNVLLHMRTEYEMEKECQNSIEKMFREHTRKDVITHATCETNSESKKPFDSEVVSSETVDSQYIIDISRNITSDIEDTHNTYTVESVVDKVDTEDNQSESEHDRKQIIEVGIIPHRNTSESEIDIEDNFSKTEHNKLKMIHVDVKHSSPHIARMMLSRDHRHISPDIVKESEEVYDNKNIDSMREFDFQVSDILEASKVGDVSHVVECEDRDVSEQVEGITPSVDADQQGESRLTDFNIVHHTPAEITITGEIENTTISEEIRDSEEKMPHSEISTSTLQSRCSLPYEYDQLSESTFPPECIVFHDTDDHKGGKQLPPSTIPKDRGIVSPSSHTKKIEIENLCAFLQSTSKTEMTSIKSDVESEGVSQQDLLDLFDPIVAEINDNLSVDERNEPPRSDPANQQSPVSSIGNDVDCDGCPLGKTGDKHEDDTSGGFICHVRIEVFSPTETCITAVARTPTMVDSLTHVLVENLSVTPSDETDISFCSICDASKSSDESRQEHDKGYSLKTTFSNVQSPVGITEEIPITHFIIETDEERCSSSEQTSPVSCVQMKSPEDSSEDDVQKLKPFLSEFSLHERRFNPPASDEDQYVPFKEEKKRKARKKRSEEIDSLVQEQVTMFEKLRNMRESFDDILNEVNEVKKEFHQTQQRRASSNLEELSRLHELEGRSIVKRSRSCSSDLVTYDQLDSQKYPPSPMSRSSYSCYGSSEGYNTRSSWGDDDNYSDLGALKYIAGKDPPRYRQMERSYSSPVLSPETARRGTREGYNYGGDSPEWSPDLHRRDIVPYTGPPTSRRFSTSAISTAPHQTILSPIESVSDSHSSEVARAFSSPCLSPDTTRRTICDSGMQQHELRVDEPRKRSHSIEFKTENRESGYYDRYRSAQESSGGSSYDDIYRQDRHSDSRDSSYDNIRDDRSRSDRLSRPNVYDSSDRGRRDRRRCLDSYSLGYRTDSDYSGVYCGYDSSRRRHSLDYLSKDSSYSGRGYSANPDYSIRYSRADSSYYRGARSVGSSPSRDRDEMDRLRDRDSAFRSRFIKGSSADAAESTPTERKKPFRSRFMKKTFYLDI